MSLPPIAPVLPGATLGVLGGGQLGRMFVQAAQALGYRTVVLDPDVASPAGQIAHEHLCAGYLDEAGLQALANAADAVTTEFENVPAAALERLAAQTRVAPCAAAVAVCQNRIEEKKHFAASGVPCAPHAAICNPDDLAAAAPALLPGILKTARLGYDGKGQVPVADHTALSAAWHELQCVPCVLEQRLALRQEISVIVVRGADGQTVHFPVQQNLHRDGILAVTQVPAPGVDAALAALAAQCAAAIAAEMAYVGVLCVEFFVVDDGAGGAALVANEMAPRPHNSGHYTIDACDFSQFEMQVRALAGLPLPPPRLHSSAVMLNLLGDLWFDGAALPQTARLPDWAALLALPGAHLHLYGKSEARPGRKMGHVTLTAASPEAARAAARQACGVLGLPAF